MPSQLGKLRHEAAEPPVGQWPGGKLGELPAPFSEEGPAGHWRLQSVPEQVWDGGLSK